MKVCIEHNWVRSTSAEMLALKLTASYEDHQQYPGVVHEKRTVNADDPVEKRKVTIDEKHH